MTPDKTTNDFNWANAVALLDAAAEAYQTHTVCDPHTDAQACIHDRGDCVVVAFRGSKAAVDFVQDAKFELAEYLWMHESLIAEVHDGFLEDFQAIGGPVVDGVKTLLAARAAFRPVFVTGHSLGGALAILCALELVREKVPVTGVYTYGQPRVGNRTFAGLYDSRLADKTWRLVNANDLVPRLPGLLLGYRHCGQEILLTPGGGYLVNPPWWQTARSDVAGFYAAGRCGHDALIGDHFLAAYRTAVAQDALPAGEGIPRATGHVLNP